jgi:NADH-quinone oxidoreductase subunit A
LWLLCRSFLNTLLSVVYSAAGLLLSCFVVCAALTEDQIGADVLRGARRVGLRWMVEGLMLQNTLLMDYLPIAVFLAVASVIGLALMVAPFLIAVRNPDPEKVSAYECGFNAFDDARMKFDVRFYLVSILFIIFDLEVAFLFPWAVAFKEVGVVGFWSMMIFLGVLTIGFIYEWRKGALEWD